MKRKVLYLFVLLSLVFVTGCGNSDKKNMKNTIKLKEGKVSIVCSADNFKFDGINQKIESTYNFNNDLYLINYKVVTTQKFKDKSVYETYRDAQKDTVKDSTDDFLYDLDYNDKKKTLVFTMAVINISYDNVDDNEKDKYSAKEILKNIESAQDAKYTCKVNGIDRSELK